ncbi:MAG: HEAT repeat domain-containing protein [bacterium]|nr:HEAT repeat domain-containing protein [bacterium]
MKRNIYSLLCCGIFIIFFIQVIYAQDHKPDFPGNSLNRVQIVVNQSYENCEPYADEIRLPIEDIAIQLFKYAEVDAIPPGTGNYDAVLKIIIEGKAEGAYHYPEGYLYTGAYLWGKISLESKKISVSEKKFDVYINSPSPVSITWNPLRPCDAPFDRAFFLSGSVVSKLLEIIYDTYGINPIISALKDENTDIQNMAIEALVNIGKPAIDPLIAAMYNENLYIRRGSIDALGKLGDSYAIEDIILALKEDDPGIRWRAAKALGKLGNKRAIEPLISALKDMNKIVKSQAARSLGEIGDTRSIEPLMAAMKDNDPGIQSYAKESLIRINGKKLNRLSKIEEK